MSKTDQRQGNSKDWEKCKDQNPQELLEKVIAI